MALIELNTTPSKRELKWFGVLFLAFFGLVGALVWFRFHEPAISRWIWKIAGTIALTYYAIPPIRRWIYLGWIYAAYPIGWTVSHVILLVLYYLLITPIGLLMKLVRYDPMHRRIRSDDRSYWVERQPTTELKRYFQQF